MNAQHLIATHARVAITGWPRAGKTTFAESITDRPVVHTDDFKGLPWADVPAAVIAECDQAGPTFAVEGVMVPRSLRKGLMVDVVLWIDGTRERLNPRQAGMGKSVVTVLQDWRATHPGTPVYVVAQDGGVKLL